MDDILALHPYTKGNISKIYIKIQGANPPSWTKTKLSWEKDLDIELSERSWQFCLERIHTSSIWIRRSLIQFKVLHRLHYSNDKLSKLYSNVSSACFRCHQSPATLGHMFWNCMSLKSFWTNFSEAISHICKEKVPPSPLISIFGIPPPEITVSKLQGKAVAFASLIARRTILLQWKSDKPSSFDSWIKEMERKEMLSVLPLEKLRYSRENRPEKFWVIWSSFIVYVKNLSPLWSYCYWYKCIEWKYLK